MNQSSGEVRSETVCVKKEKLEGLRMRVGFDIVRSTLHLDDERNGFFYRQPDP